MIPMHEEILNILWEYKERFVEKYGLTKPGLFGSFARGEATDESDVDLCFNTARANRLSQCTSKRSVKKSCIGRFDIVHPHRLMCALFLKRREQEVIDV